MKRTYDLLSVLSILALLQFTGGCSSIVGLFRDSDGGVGFDDQARYEEEGDPKIRAGLVLRVAVTASGSPAVEESMKEVDLNGNIILPLIGAVKCDSMTIVALQDKVREAYKKYYLDPQVSVSFAYVENSGMKSPWGSVLVTGCVAHPGPVNMPSTRDLNVTRALMLAGNVTAFADKTRVRVTRREKDGKLKRFSLDIESIGRDGRSELDIVLKPGDVIWVPESWY